ncbi:hypothetical protein BDM02DRAFT_3122849 [Thelephora ganbajun]|uniref:Uncharacterized protein n=1 Tax=Thelephora ganbajun TaxID=370292 RepID=A0ACB6Z2M2_THEGA|nr:hypothetical protein BDM02DRAFT_3122849 [Thelephora ganbajun]
MVPTFVKTDDTTLKKAENEVAAVLVHLKKLLRAKNWLRSPLLRLPIEIIVHILSYIMQDAENSSVWRPIFSMCYHIHNIICISPELWRKADFMSDRLARLAFERSHGNLEVITADLLARDEQRNEQARNSLGFCRDHLVLHGHRLHTLEVQGCSSDITSFSWILERPLLRLRHVKIHLFPDCKGWRDLSLSDPVILELPTDLPLRVLDLRNATLPWSSNLFSGLSELHLDFVDCDSLVEISEEDLFGILEASPRLESLSLLQLIPKIPAMNDQQQHTPTRVVKFTNLTSLELDSFPMLVGYILAHVDIPVIDSLKIRGEFYLWEVESSIEHIFPNDRLPSQLFSNPPIFEVWPDGGYGIYDALKVNIGSCHMQFDFDMDESEAIYGAIMACILPLVPPSATTLRLDYSDLDEEEWSDFFWAHPEVRSIEFSKQEPVSESLWDALLPPGPDATTLCPKLESITLSEQLPSLSLLSCLLERKNAGAGLRHLKLWAVGDRWVGILRLFVEELEVINVPDELMKRWGCRSPPEVEHEVEI